MRSPVYPPLFPDPPQGMKLTIDTGDKKALVRAWLTERSTLVRQITRTWGVADDDIPAFLKALWDYLISDEVAILRPVRLVSSKGKPLANGSGVY